MRVITVAEMAVLCGTKIPTNRFNGKWRARSMLKWPRQPPPTPEMWTTFRQLFKRAFCARSKYTWVTHPVLLDTRLGCWLRVERHIVYDAYRISKTLFIRSQDIGTSSHKRYTIGIKSNYFMREGERHQLPPDTHPVDTYHKKHKYFSHQEYNIAPIPPTCIVSTCDANTSDLNTLKNTDELVACSDGSCDPITGKAAFNWRITTPDEIATIEHSAPTYTNQKYMNSYRSEYDGLRDLVRYLKEHDLNQIKTTIHCDSESCTRTLNAGPSNEGYSGLDKAEADIIAAIFRHLECFRDVTFCWVKSHQDEDDDIPFEQRPLPVRLNILCNKKAKQCMRTSALPTTRPSPFEGANATLYFGMNMVTTELNEQIQYASQAPKMFEYIRERFEWTDRQCSCTSWKSLGRAKTRLPRHRSIRITKMLYGWLNVGRQKGKMGKEHICPCCGTEEETQLHMYHCTNAKMQDTFRSSLATAMKQWIQDGITTPVFTGFARAICTVAHHDPANASYDLKCPKTWETMEDQRTLGSEAILRGLLHVNWVYLLQDTWIPSTTRLPNRKKAPRKDPLEQSVSLISGVWNIFEALWKQRNEILHGAEYALSDKDNSRLLTRYCEFRQNKHLLLRRCDHHT